MSEVKRHLAGDIYDGAEVVYASDFDNSTRLFLDAAERAVASERREKELQQRLTAADERADVLEGLLRLARQFVTNGVELGYIAMPDPETPDAAHDLVPMIDAALKP